MASRKSLFSRPNYIFPATTESETNFNPEGELELDEADVWNISVNTMTEEDYKEPCKNDAIVGDDGDEGGVTIPPHEYLARTRGASHSVHEGIGRTLKGRDLRRVRNAIWKKVGFED
ncbi:Senescence regulator S40 [Sesbania bispinosa]|nr:Senescence regulator S40 [Sesbania bispinosa]